MQPVSATFVPIKESTLAAATGFYPQAGDGLFNIQSSKVLFPSPGAPTAPSLTLCYRPIIDRGFCVLGSFGERIEGVSPVRLPPPCSLGLDTNH